MNDTIGDLLHHPAFGGCARLLLPWDDRPYDETMRLRDLGALLPYHSHVDADVTVSSINRMIDDANAGKRICFDIYDQDEKAADQTRTDTGLFFFRGRPGAPVALISPGGGFEYVASVHEGFPYAVQISDRGYNAFVLKYRAGRGARLATEDLAASISYIFQNANSLGVSTAGYSLWGSSAGARMAAAIGSYGPAGFGAPDLPRPSVVVMAYTGHSDVASNEPATFVVVGERDGIAAATVMERRVAALRRGGTDVEYRKYPRVGHGFGVGAGTTAEGWIADAMHFWAKHIK